MGERDELDEAIERYRVCDIEKCLEYPVAANSWSALGPIILDEKLIEDAALFRKDPAETRRRCSERQHSSEAFELLREAADTCHAAGYWFMRDKIQTLLHKVESET